MQNQKLGVSALTVSRLAYGCWRLAGNPPSSTPETRAEGRRAVASAYDAGYTLFDNANIYGRGESEKILGAALREISGMRERIVLITKCGVRHAGDPDPDSPHRWDFSGDYLVRSCEESLTRLGVDTVDVFML